MPAKPPENYLDYIERWLLRAILIAVAVLALLIGFAVWHTRHYPAAPTTPSTTAAIPAAKPDATTTLTIIIDFGDGAQKRLTGLPFTQGMTALDAMNLARQQPHSFNFMAGGTGETSLVSQIDDVANETGPGGTGTRAWQFWINQQYGTTSAGAAALHAGDRLTWAFRKYEANPGLPPE